jgi:hypothetical protein
MKIKLGFAVSNLSDDSNDLVRNIEKVLELDNEAFELSLTRVEKLKQKFTNKTFDLIKKFKYRSIHTLVKDSNLKNVYYPSREYSKWKETYDFLIQKINPNALVFHPDLIKDFEWLNKEYGSLIAFENLDKEKKFGLTIKDLDIVFDKCKKAKFVFDLNHLYTNDKSMKSASIFYNHFKSRITHYHISGFGGFHDCFCRTKEDVILTGISDLTLPLIHEGNALEKNLIEEESEYILKRLNKLKSHK